MLRFASSPTGDMHIDSLRIALINYIVSKQRDEDLIIRVEDTDKEQNIEGKDQEILDILGLFSIEHSQVIYQSESIRFHTAMALQLMHEKKAFSCFCSSSWLDKKREESKEAKKNYMYDDACRDLHPELVIDNTNPFTIRIKRAEGKMSFESNVVDSFVIMSQNKIPTYNFATAVDDMLNNISIIISTDDKIDNTPRQEHIRESLKYDNKIEYVHIPVLQSDDAVSVKKLLEEGFLPEAISNYLISIGIDSPKEIFKMSEAMEWFNLSNISKSPARFDMDILKHINKEHLKNLDAKELSRYVGFADEEIGKLARIYLEEVYTTKELKEKIAAIFAKRSIPKEFSNEVAIIANVIKGAPHFEEYEDFKNYTMEKSGLEGENFTKPLYILLTNAQNGPEVADIYKYIKNYLGEIVK